MAMLLNGRPYAFNDIQTDEKIPLNSIQLMEIFHTHGGGGMSGEKQHGMMGRHGGGMSMMMSMAHPIHLHGQSFQIVSRSIDADMTENYATVRDGFKKAV